MLGGADNPNGELPSYITGADIFNDFLVRTGLRSGVSELQLPCFTAVWQHHRSGKEDNKE
ncbi:InsB [Shigella sonnei]|nr:InsB [Shigella sonnei]